MKILSLNTWDGGHLKDKITKFIVSHISTTDVFCFQETKPAFDPIASLLEDNFMAVKTDKVLNEKDELFLTIFLRKELFVVNTETILEAVPMTGLGLLVTVESKTGTYSICNYHGHPRPGDKLDTADRLKASQELIEVLQRHSEPGIIMGDFNLDITTKSIEMFEDAGFANLIKQYNIPTTRNHVAWEKYPEDKQYYADFTFVSADVEVVSFSVPPDVVSDHQAMILEIA